MNHSRKIQTIQKNIEKIVIDKKLGDKTVTDGIVNEDIWKITTPKIVFVLKDTNEQETSLTDLLNNPFSGDYHFDNESIENGNNRIIGNLRKTWLNIARWTKGIISLIEYGEAVSWEEIKPGSNWYNDGCKAGKKDGWLKELENSAVINTKKTVGRERSIDRELREAVETYGEFTWEQIIATEPNIVIFCGVGWVFDKYCLKETWKESAIGHNKHCERDNTLLIQYWHPNARKFHDQMYHVLMDIVKEAIAK